MHILFLSQLLPHPLDAGPKVRSYYVLRHLAAAGHDVTLLAFSRESDPEASVRHLAEFCEVVTVPMARSRGRDALHLGRSLLTRAPFLIARDHVPAMYRQIRKLVAAKRFDAVHADQLWMAPYALAARQAANGAAPRLVLDQHNAMFLVPQRLADSERSGWRRALWRREAKAMRRYEWQTCRRFDRVVWVTHDDRAAVALPKQESGPRSLVIPICVDTAAQPVIERVERPWRVTFLGGLHWPPNAAGIVWFAREAWPRMAAACPDAVLTVIGKNPPAELLAEGSRAPAGGSLEVTGYVDDPTPYLAETAVFIVPLLAGGGMRVKIIDGWSWGLPVVSTTIGAEGIDYHDGDDLLIADRPEAFAAAVSRVWQDRALAGRLSRGGRATVEQCYDWRTVYPEWNEVYGG